MLTLYERILKERQRLQKKIETLKSELEQYPEGKLICCCHRNASKWYRSDGHTRTYIPKRNRNLAEQLAAKRYLSHVLEDCIHEQTALDLYLKHHSPVSHTMSKLLLESPGYQELLSPYFQPLTQKLTEWMNEPYEHNLKSPENLTHKTASGHFVRSKSEALIDLFLYRSHIPFRYECALEVGELKLFPDFTIRHPKTGEVYYWEHFERMDDSSYIKNAFSKLETYASHRIIPAISLITTYETQQIPLNTEMIEKIIEYYFL